MASSYKLRRLQRVYFHKKNCKNHEAAIRTVNDLYVKTPNAIFARHLLATAKQQQG